MGDAVTLVEMGPRDGFQPIGPFIETETKLRFIRRLAEAGLRRIEIGSFVSPRAVPQLRDTPELLAACRGWPDFLPQILVPNARGGIAAMEAGAPMIAFVLSVSEAHNRNNVRRTPQESAAEYEQLVARLPSGLPVRLNFSTAFDCPFDGRVPEEATLALLDRLVPARPDAEICLCDTTGRVAPDHVARLFERAIARFPSGPTWAFHAHDTYGLGLANAYAACQRGVRVIDAAIGGLGGCPFAPGATGNVATEDVAWMFERMGISTGLDIDALIGIAADAAALPGAMAGGRARAALLARSCGAPGVSNAA